MHRIGIFGATLSMMIWICLLVVSRPASVAGPVVSQDPPEEKGQIANIDVKLSAPKSVIASGESLQLRVEIWNEGSSDVFVCKSFDMPGFPLCSLALFVEDNSGRSGSRHGIAADFSPWDKKPLSAVLMRDWIVLQPRHFYGAVVTVDPDSYPRLQKPGRYRLLAQYRSGGLMAGYQGTVSADPDELAHLPAKSWRGEIESSPIVIHVVPKKN